MKFIKKIIPIIIIIMIIMILILVIIKNRDKPVALGDNSKQEEYINNILTRVNIVDEYMTVKSCIDKFYSTINTKDEDVIELLDKNFVSKYNIDTKNIKEYAKYTGFNIKDMYVTEKFKDIAVYFVYGRQLDNKNYTYEDYGYIVMLDRKNISFSIIPYKYMIDNKYDKIENINLDDIEVDYITKNSINNLEYQYVSQEDIAQYYLSNYKENISYDIENAYNLLDEQYRNKRFGSLESYKEYVEENKNIINSSILYKYSVNDICNNKKYICIDNYSNYYIFNENSFMNYSVFLDNYTIEDQSCIQKYNNATEEEKVAMNIEKFINMINAKDYNSAYNKLDKDFRNNYFKNINNFKKYIQENLFEINEVNYLECNKIGGLYTMKTQIKNYVTDIIYINARNTRVDKTFIVKLKDVTDFVISFEV